MEGMLLGDIPLLLGIVLVGVDEVHEEGSANLDHHELHHPLLATVGEVLRLLPMRQHIRLLTVPEWPEVMHLLLLRHHHRIDFFVLHYILNEQGGTR